MLEIAALIVLLVALSIFANRNRVSGWFPELTRLQVATVVAGIYVAGGTLFLGFLLVGRTECQAISAEIMMQGSGFPFLEEPETEEGMAALFTERCQAYREICRLEEDGGSSRVEKICAAYPAQP